MTEQAKKSLEKIKSRSVDFQFTMLGRLLSDCKYYLGAGNRYAPNLWAWNERDQLDIMRELCATLKPDWLTLEQIDELEKQMIEEDTPVEELPKLWNQKYQEYLGVTPKDEKEGILQDVHWSMGDIGYFPSYALGNAFAAQIYHTMKKELPVEELLKQGKRETGFSRF